MSLLKKKSNAATTAVNNAGNGHGSMPEDDMLLLASNEPTPEGSGIVNLLASTDDSGALTGLRRRPDYGESDSYTSEMNDANSKTAMPNDANEAEEFDVPAKTAERTILPRQTTPQSGAYSYQDISGQAMPIAEPVQQAQPKAQTPQQKVQPQPSRIRQDRPVERDVWDQTPTTTAPSWVTGSEEAKGVVAGFSIAVETDIKIASEVEMYISSVEFNPRDAMRVEKFSFTADKEKAVVFHKLTAEDVAKQLSSPAFRVRARIVLASEYEDMFQSLLGTLRNAQAAPTPKVEQMVNREIAWAKQTLKKKDRVIWFLRLYRLALANSLLKTIPSKTKKVPAAEPQVQQASKTADTMPMQPQGNPPPPQSEAPAQIPAKPRKLKIPTLKQQLKQLLDKYKNDFSAKGGDPAHTPTVDDFPQLKRQLEHFYSMPVAKIQNTALGVQSPADLIRGFSAAEQEWQEKGASLLKPHAEDQVFKKFSDGWAWWWLPRASCDDESKAMGHCGNSPMVGRSGISILSLREPVQYGNETLWYPHATFILHGDGDTGSLGEMKGRANKKPVAKYHPYIIELLKDPRIHAVVGGGYLPEENFSMEDLTPEQRKEISTANPNIGLTIKDYFSTYGFDDKLAARVNAVLELDKNAQYDPNFGFILNKWATKEDFIEANGNREAKEAMQFIETGKYDQSQPDGDEMADLLDEMETNEIYNAGLDLQYNYGSEIRQWYDEADGSNPFDPRSPEWVKQVIKDIFEIRIKPKLKENKGEGGGNLPDYQFYAIPVIQKFYDAYISGGPDQDSTETVLNEMIDDANSSLKDSTIESTREYPYMLVVTPEQAVEAASDRESGTRRYRSHEFDTPSVQMPYQWDEWSEERAVDYLHELLSQRPKRPETEKQQEIPYEGEGMRVSRWLKNPLFSKSYSKSAN
jgi:hypothetical protein